MPGFGSGLAHALTAGLTGYQEGADEQRKKLIVLAATQRAEARQKQLDEIAKLGALTNAANAGMDVTPVQSPGAPPSTPPSAPPPSVMQSGGVPATVPDTGSVRAMKGQNPTTPEAGQPAPAQPSQDGTVLGTFGGMQVRIPPGGAVGKAARDDAAKQAQRTADLLKRAQPLNARLPDGHPFKLTDDQLAGVAADPSLYNEWAKGALGIAKDPLALHKAMRDYDVEHPTRDVTGDNTSWQTVQDNDGNFVQVNPKTGATRPIGLKGKMPAGNDSPMQIAAKARTMAAISEMRNADESMAQYEQDIASGKVRVGATKQLLQRVANSFTHDDPMSMAAQSFALSQLDTSDPALARYIRRGLSFAEGESQISGRPSDFRTRMAAFLSTAASGASPEMVQDIQSRRNAILTPLREIQQEHRSPTTAPPNASPNAPPAAPNAPAKPSSGRTYTYGGKTYRVP